MKFYLIDYKKWKIPVFIQDNKMDSTLFAIHGINSSSDFIIKLSEFSNNFNLVAINLPGSKYFDIYNPLNKEDITMENWIKIADFVSKKLETKQNYLLAHSMGGGVSVRLAHLPIFKKCFNVSTINPTLKNSKLLRIYRQYRQPKNLVQHTFSKGLKVGMNYYHKTHDWIEPFARDDSVWRQILDNNIMNTNKLDELDNFYQTTKAKSIMIIGSLDVVIGTNDFYGYAKSINVPCYIIGRGHSPLSTNPREFYVFFKKQINGKKRWFWQKIMKLPKKFYEQPDLD